MTAQVPHTFDDIDPSMLSNLTVYGYPGPFVNHPVISIYYNDTYLGDVTEKEIRVFQVPTHGTVTFRFKRLAAQVRVDGDAGVQVDFDRIWGGLMVNTGLPTVSKEQEVIKVHPGKKEKKKVNILDFLKKHKKPLIIGAAASAVVIAVLCIAGAIYNNMLTEQAQKYLDGKMFIEGEYVRDESAHVYAFDDGQVRQEWWFFDEVYQYSLDDPATSYKAVGSLISNEVTIKYKTEDGWYTLLYVVINEDGTVEPENDWDAWRPITMEELESLRASALCEHNFKQTPVRSATCTQEGEVKKTCKDCGYEETESVSKKDHNYKNKICTVCGAEKPLEKSTIEPNAWYSYQGVLRFKNCEILTVSPFGNGYMVHFKSVCKNCHVVAEMSELGGPEPNYPATRVHSCRNCGTWTNVEIQVAP